MEKSARGTAGTTTAAKEASGKRDESRDMECWDDDRKGKGADGSVQEKEFGHPGPGLCSAVFRTRDLLDTERDNYQPSYIGPLSDCKVIAGDEVVHQHRLVCGVVKVKECKIKRTRAEKRIRTWKLTGDVGREFKDKVNRQHGTHKEQTGNEKWIDLKGVLLSTAEEVCGTSKGGKKIDKETCWWSEEVQTSIKKKKEAFKNRQREGTDQLKEVHKEKKKEAKRAVAKAKEEGYKEWYENLDTREGEKTIYRIAKQRAEAKRDIKEIKVIKDQQGEVLTDGEKIKERWREYYTTLLNKENQRDELEDIPPIEELTRKEIIDAITAMKKEKAAGCSGVSADMIKALEESGADIMVDIIGTVWEEKEMPEDWKQSEIVPIYKQKGDPLDCGNYGGIKLLEHGMKILEIIEGRLGKTAYDRVPRDLVYWSLRKRKHPEKLIRLVKETYKKATTLVRTDHGKTGQFEIEVGLHQGSGLSPFLFTIVLDTISEECRNGLPWELLFADDLAFTDSEEELQRRWLKWQIGLESKGLKVNTGKTEVMVSGRNRTKVNIKDKEGRELNQVDQFKYLGVTFSEEGGSETAVRARVKAAGQKWRELGPVVADKKIPTKLKTELYTTVVRPVILYGAECWTTGVKEENILEKTEMRMLRRIKGVTLKDKMKSEDIRKELGVGSIKSKARESRLRWFGHVHRREQESNLRQVMGMEVPGRRPRGRSRGRWRDLVDRDMRELRVVPEVADDRDFWRRRIRTADPSLG
ncbi:endonuclease-reverse transcriptase HmRTE-e01 [Elysia marginata]|uniref:Endonuclease-reverse transcriptase HmRTE-e01 n=1 Tax=Elysia marginata TaxID=1093978 RepID=A0AAV4IM93_9GAST|nr:endonuclease-reverse transcriptase HmRTE-e01 [Elysia marginata]